MYIMMALPLESLPGSLFYILLASIQYEKRLKLVERGTKLS